jgi:hypothetical protein
VGDAPQKVRKNLNSQSPWQPRHESLSRTYTHSCSDFHRTNRTSAAHAYLPRVCVRHVHSRIGLNCTLTGTPDGVRAFCTKLREWNPLFNETDFKITDGLEPHQRQAEPIHLTICVAYFAASLFCLCARANQEAHVHVRVCTSECVSLYFRSKQQASHATFLFVPVQVQGSDDQKDNRDCCLRAGR